MDGVDYVARERTVRWYRVTDAAGTEFRLKMLGSERGSVTFAHDGRPVSPELWGPGAVRGWLLSAGLTPAGSKSPEWARQMAERRDRAAAAA